MESSSATSQIYTLFSEENYEDVVELLTTQFISFEDTVAYRSLLAFSYFRLQNFEMAADLYEQLRKSDPTDENTILSLITCYYKIGDYQTALRLATTATVSAENEPALKRLQAAIRYENNDLQGAGKAVGNSQADPMSLVQMGCVLYKEQKFKEAREKFEAAHELHDETRLLTLYAIALCYYQENDLTNARSLINDILDEAIKQFPEVARSTRSQRSVGNTFALEQSALIETFNLRAALEMKNKNMSGVIRALNDMPFRHDSELDAVTLHNKALVQIDSDPSGGFQKLHFLLTNPPFPPETFGNLLLMYCEHELYDLAAGLLADNGNLAAQCLTPDRALFLNALIVAQTSQEEAYHKLEQLENRHLSALNQMMKQMNRANEDAMLEWVKKYETALNAYIPVMCNKERLLYDIGNYAAVEAHLRAAPDQATEHEVWRLNMAHTLYAAENYEGALEYYGPIIDDHEGRLLQVPAVVLANTCVCHIMLTQNADAEELMRAIDAEERAAMERSDAKPYFHLTIVNLVIGTLYCVKNNMAFGVERVLKAMDPPDQKISADTWLHVKLPILALIDELSKNITSITSRLLDDIIDFLTQAESVGQDVSTVISSTESGLLEGQEDAMPTFRTIGEEARMFKRLFIRYKLM
ncbi:Tetratricopeptide repeat [Carpediemonas membranifera]|uniref:Tetratricopeptide repeat n=1 Tax=Carpediemonas membranifera TaxID=201153 RepID=A0A8J6AYN3_9EUKA|nr:Tetratricopeptide repeat [Carpediemonas membranifera]|eukprot:KAG9391653.1 Tetratricopeptide repeat [Carpediemonas membranifera]